MSLEGKDVLFQRSVFDASIFKKGDTIYFNVNEFDTVKPYSVQMKIGIVGDNYAVTDSGYYIDKDTRVNFSFVPKYEVKQNIDQLMLQKEVEPEEMEL